MSKFNFLQFDDFVSLLRLLIHDKKELDALFCTYSDVFGHERGEVDVESKKGLSITITSDSATGVTARLRGGTNEEEAVQLAIEKQAKVEECFIEEKAGQFYKAENILFVVYMGLSGFEAAVKFVKFLRSNYPKAYIATLTCDCGLEYKTMISKELEDDKVVDASILTTECGGGATMRDMLDALIDTWSGDDCNE